MKISANGNSISCHPQRFIYSNQNGVASIKGKVCAVVSRG